MASKSKLRVGVVGTGGIFTWAHKDAWLKQEESQMVALCDIKIEKAQEHAKALGIETVTANYKDLIKRDDIDIIDICTPNLLHSEIAVAALKAGKHVFCEKPDAVSPAEAMKMAAAAKASGKTLMVMRNNRFRADSQYMKQYIADGHMGEIYTGRCGWVRRRGIPGKGGWFTTKALSGGGPLIDLGVHMIDLALWLMGNPRPVAVVGSTYTKFADMGGPGDSVHSKFGEAKSDGVFDVEDLAIGFIKFDNGSSLQIEFSWASNVEKEETFVELRGTKSGCSLKGSGLGIYTETSGVVCDVRPSLPKPRLDQHTANIHHFVDVLKGRAKPSFVPEQGVHMIQILSAIYKSAQTGKEVRI